MIQELILSLLLLSSLSTAATQKPIVSTAAGKVAAVRTNETDPSLCNGSRGISGYVDTTDDRHIYFWALPSQNEPEQDPVILWLTGGPGASGVTIGAFTELGPCFYAENYTTVRNDHGWHTNATVIFVDQPVNVGYSYSSQNVKTLQESTTDLYTFLEGFFSAFPEYSKQPFYIAGESYGGSYVPALAARIHEHQRTATPTTYPPSRINLQGILVGNGLFNDALQRRGFYELGCIREFEIPGNTFLNASTCGEMLQYSQHCEDLSFRCIESRGDLEICSASDNFCRKHIVGMIGRAGRNPYDIRKHCYTDDEGGELCLPPTTLYDWMNQTYVRKGMNVDSESTYTPINYEVEAAFEANGEIGYPSDFFLGELLDKGLRVLIYVGNMDWYCNAPGMRYLVDSLGWTGQAAFRVLPYRKLFLSDEPAPGGRVAFTREYQQPVEGHENAASYLWGYHKSYGHLSFFEIDNAGHMVPGDKPREAKEMLMHWIAGNL